MYSKKQFATSICLNKSITCFKAFLSCVWPWYCFLCDKWREGCSVCLLDEIDVLLDAPRKKDGLGYLWADLSLCRDLLTYTVDKSVLDIKTVSLWLFGGPREKNRRFSLKAVVSLLSLFCTMQIVYSEWAHYVKRQYLRLQLKCNFNCNKYNIGTETILKYQSDFSG